MHAPPAFADESDKPVAKAMAELTRRGLDASSLIRYGLAPEVIGGVVTLLLDLSLGHLSDESEEAGRAAQWLGIVRDGQPLGIASVADLTNETTTRIVTELLVGGADKLAPWLLHAPISDLIALRPSDHSAFPSEECTPADLVSLHEQYRWAAERFSVTRLEEWSTASLHLELRWQRFGGLPPCAPELMNDRTIPPQRLEAEIARRAVSPASDFGTAALGDLRASLAMRMQARATDLLRLGSRGEAASLFEFAASQQPDDSTAVNNLGFCLIPDEPRRALGLLQRAEAMGFHWLDINLYNQALCHVLLGEYDTCLDMAARRWDAGDSSTGRGATLWRFDGTTVDLVLDADALPEIYSLATTSAYLAGDQEARALWRTRAA